MLTLKGGILIGDNYVIASGSAEFSMGRIVLVKQTWPHVS